MCRFAAISSNIHGSFSLAMASVFISVGPSVFISVGPSVFISVEPLQRNMSARFVSIFGTIFFAQAFKSPRSNKNSDHNDVTGTVYSNSVVAHVIKQSVTD